MTRDPTRFSPAVRLLFTGLLLTFFAVLVAPQPAQAQGSKFDEFTATSPKAGEMAPDFTLMTVDNQPFNLMEAAAEKPLIIEFGSFT
jgi:hypothetical protein